MRIGILCSGGDAPGMNACIRGIVRAANEAKDEVVGICHGYQGILDEEFYVDQYGSLFMGRSSVSGLSRLGGTILHSSRCKRFMEEEGLQAAANVLRKRKIDALLPIGGNGTLSGAIELLKFWGGQIVGLPGTIDNDLLGTDATIGFATSVSTAVDAVDKLYDTAGSHDLMFIVEVMGRYCGDIAMYTALASGAEIVSTAELVKPIPVMVDHLKMIRQLGKKSVMMIVSEGDTYGGAYDIQEKLKEAGNPFDSRVVVLGHILRGGSPCPADRILAAELGTFAVRSLHDGATDVMAGKIGGELTLTPLQDCITDHRRVSEKMKLLLKVLAS